jgi:hypothetical protein
MPYRKIGYQLRSASALLYAMQAEANDLEALLISCEDAIAHLHALIDQTADRLTLLALHDEARSQPRPTNPPYRAISTILPGI